MKGYDGQLNPETFPWKAIRTFAASKITRIDPRTGRSYCKPVDGPDRDVTTYHRTEAAAERTARSATYCGYIGILKSGRVEPNIR